MIVLESYSYSTKDLKYILPPTNDPLKFEERTMNTPAYQIYTDKGMSSGNIASYDTGDFSIINYSFKLIPTRVQNLLSILVPVTLLILANGISFWFPVYKMFTNRIAIGMTSLLADFALSFSLPVPNSKQFMWVDIYLLLSYLYISLSILWSYLENKYVKDINIKKPKKQRKQKKQNRQSPQKVSNIELPEVSDKTGHMNITIGSEEEKSSNSPSHSPTPPTTPPLPPTPPTPPPSPTLPDTPMSISHSQSSMQQSVQTSIISSTITPQGYGNIRNIILEKYNNKRNANYDKEELNKYVDEIMKDSQSTSELLIQPYLGQWRGSVRYIYMTSWIVLNLFVLAYGEYYIHSNPSLKMKCL